NVPSAETPVLRRGISLSRRRRAGPPTPAGACPAGCGTALMCRSGRGRASPAVGRLVAQEFIKVAAVCHLAEGGQRAQPGQPLAHLLESRIDGVLLRLCSST